MNTAAPTARPYPGEVGELSRNLRAYRRSFRRGAPTGPPDLAVVPPVA